MTKNKTIAVAMSGGVDSSATAYLLKQQGYNIIGVFMHLWHDSELEKSENACCSLESREDARRVAKQLGFKFYTLNLDNQFKKHIVDDFVKQYSRGLTPNPCIRCNQIIKFDLLLKKIKALGADYLATGHYVKIKEKHGKKTLCQAKDKLKDQSYFLYQITQEQLQSLIFPLGNYKKEKIIKIAQKNDLLPSTKKESQDVCFVPRKNLAVFLNKHIKQHKLKPGKIIDINSQEKIGEHEGLAVYTLGQRSGIGIGGQGPYYVVKKDEANNVLFVTNKEEDEHLYSQELEFGDENWVSGHEPEKQLKCKAKSRYAQELAEVVVEKNKVKFKNPQRAITPGQSIVFYRGEEMLGGGIIKKIK